MDTVDEFAAFVIAAIAAMLMLKVLSDGLLAPLGNIIDAFLQSIA